MIEINIVMDDEDILSFPQVGGSWRHKDKDYKIISLETVGVGVSWNEWKATLEC